MNQIMPKSLPSPMSVNFAKLPDVRIERSKFKRNHTVKTALDSGWAIPVFLDEVLPGDSHTLNATIFARLSTPIKPLLDNIYLDTMFFFVPMRLIWEHTANFFGERKPNPDSSIAYEIPQVEMPTSPGVVAGSIFDYMGIPLGCAEMEVNALPLRAYNKIYNDWLRDQNLIDSVVERVGDSGDLPADFELLRCGKRYDYFTSCLPNPQKGDAVEIPVGSDSAPVNLVPHTTSTAKMLVKKAADGVGAGNVDIYSDASSQLYTDGGFNVVIDPNGRLVADLSSALATTINDLRYAVQLQALLEKDARGGSRMIESNYVHFGVVSSDARLDRSEYLGGGTSVVNFHPVAQTTYQGTPTAKDSLANLSAFGTLSGSGHGFTKSFEEHGYILGLCRIRADLHYQQGLDKLWSRKTRYDFPYPVFAHIGEQAVLSREIYCDGTGDDDDVFGYQERYAEMRTHRSMITSVMRSTYATPLDYWHLAQEFDTRPVLDQDFIEENPPIDRVIAVPAEPQFLMDIFYDLTSARPLPVNSIPTLGGRF